MIRVLVHVSHPAPGQTVRRVVGVEHVPTHGRTAPGCHGLVPVYVAGRRVRFIPCGRRLPADRVCPGCATTITTVHITNVPADAAAARTR